MDKKYKYDEMMDKKRCETSELEMIIEIGDEKYIVTRHRRRFCLPGIAKPWREKWRAMPALGEFFEKVRPFDEGGIRNHIRELNQRMEAIETAKRMLEDEEKLL